MVGGNSMEARASLQTGMAQTNINVARQTVSNVQTAKHNEEHNTEEINKTLNNPVTLERTSGPEDWQAGQKMRTAGLKESDISNEALDNQINKINQSLESSFYKLQYQVHEKTNMVMIQVIDTNTDETLREIPPESRLDAIGKMLEVAGLLFDGQG